MFESNDVISLEALLINNISYNKLKLFTYENINRHRASSTCPLF